MNNLKKALTRIKHKFDSDSPSQDLIPYYEESQRIIKNIADLDLDDLHKAHESLTVLSGWNKGDPILKNSESFMKKLILKLTSMQQDSINFLKETEDCLPDFITEMWLFVGGESTVLLQSNFTESPLANEITEEEVANHMEDFIESQAKYSRSSKEGVYHVRGKVEKRKDQLRLSDVKARRYERQPDLGSI
jgi:hypothetical protein